MKIGIVIPTLQKTEPYLRLCVESLRQSVDWDIVVMSNGGPVYPLKDLKAQHYHTTTQGQCNAVNAAVQQLSPDTDYIMISNDDMYYAPDWLKDMDKLEEWPLCWSPNLVEPTNNNGSAPPFLKLDAGFTLDEFNRAKVDEFVKNYNKDEVTTGFNFPVFIRKDLWDTIGGYDTHYDPWGSNSDTDLQTLIELAGVQPTRVRDVLVYHFSNKSGTFDGTHQDDWQKNWDYYTTKWGFNRDDDPKPDTWMATNMVNQMKNKFHPAWEGRFNAQRIH